MLANFRRLIESPDGETYRSVLRQLQAQPYYAPYTTELKTLHAQLQADQYTQAEQMLHETLRGNLLLSPRAHAMAARMHTALGRPGPAEAEQYIAHALLAAIRATGDGSAERPLAVSRVEDQNDLLDSLGLQKTAQALMQTPAGPCDKISLRGGRELWFDLTGIYGRLG